MVSTALLRGNISTFIGVNDVNQVDINLELFGT